MSDSPELRSLRTMAWERGKGELNSMKHTFWSGHDHEDPDAFKLFVAALENFITTVEDQGLHE